MTAEELRALVAQGPAVVMVAKDDMLALLDERDALRQALRDIERLNDNPARFSVAIDRIITAAPDLSDSSAPCTIGEAAK